MKKTFNKILWLALCMFVVGFLFFGDNPNPSKTKVTDNDKQVPPKETVTSDAVIYTDNFNGANDTNALKARGYKVWYRGTGPQGLYPTWFQGASGVFFAYEGPTTGYVAANYQVVTGTNNIDSWLVLPKLTGGVASGDTLRFWARSPDGSIYPDSVRVMVSASDSVPEGTWTELGRFKVSIAGWQQKIFVNSLTSANGRYAIRYCVVDGGPSGNNSDYIGIDLLEVTRSAAPTGWTPQTSGLTTSLNTVSAVNQNVGWIGGNNGVVLRTVNGGTNWTNVTGSPIGTNAVYCICGLDANTCLVSTSPASGTFVYRTTNGGANWTQVFTQVTGFIDDIKFQNASTGFMYGDPVGSRWSLWKSTNGGVTWDSTGLFLSQAGTEAGWNNAMWLSGNNLWFGTSNTRVYRSTNFGSSWAYGVTTGSPNSYSVAFLGSIGFTGQNTLLKSTDGGATYATVTLPGSGTAFSFHGLANRFWYSRGSQIYWSSDNGTNFASQYTGTGTYTDLDLVLDGNVIRGWAVTSGGGIAMYNEVLSGVSNNQNEIPENYSLSQNYPNPFNPSTKINYDMPKSGNVKLVVFDLLGREVMTLVNDFKQAGSYTVEFNASQLSSGVYFYRIESGDFTATKKMLLVK